jgi:hypothetical protein
MGRRAQRSWASSWPTCGPRPMICAAFRSNPSGTATAHGPSPSRLGSGRLRFATVLRSFLSPLRALTQFAAPDPSRVSRRAAPNAEDIGDLTSP